MEKHIESQAGQKRRLQEMINKQSELLEEHKKSLDESKKLASSQATKFAVQSLVSSLKQSIDTGLYSVSGQGVDARELSTIVKKELALSLLQDCDQEDGNSPVVVFKYLPSQLYFLILSLRSQF